MKSLICFDKFTSAMLRQKKVGDAVDEGFVAFRHETPCGTILIVCYPPGTSYQKVEYYTTYWLTDCGNSGVHYGFLSPIALNNKCPDYEEAWKLFKEKMAKEETLDEANFVSLSSPMFS